MNSLASFYGVANNAYRVMTIVILVEHFFLLGRMNEKRWKGLIPFYSDFILYKKTWGGDKYILQCVITILAICITVKSFTIVEVTQYLYQLIIFFLVMVICILLSIIIDIVACYKLGRCFGYGKLFAVGLVFIQPVFLLILILQKKPYTPYKEL